MTKIVKVECLPGVHPVEEAGDHAKHAHHVHRQRGAQADHRRRHGRRCRLGDTSSWYRGELQESIIAMIATSIAPRILLGEDPRHIEKIVAQMDLLVRDNNQAKATVDFALHDLKGKLLGVPVYELFGGRTLQAARQGWVLSAGKPDDVAAEAQRAKDIGFALFKMKIGYGTMAGRYRYGARGARHRGRGRDLTIDANGFWSYEKALHIIRKIDPAGWI